MALSQDAAHTKWITEEEAMKLVKELGVSDKKAKELLSSVPRNDQGLINATGASSLNEKISHLQNELCPEFAKFDLDDSGFVSMDEATQILSERMKNLKESTIKTMVARYDENKDGQFKFREFIYFAALISARKDYLEARFKEIDQGKKGFLDPEAVAAALCEEFLIDHAFAKLLVADFDSDKDGKIDKQEFFNVMNTITLE